MTIIVLYFGISICISVPEREDNLLYIDKGG